MWVTSEKTDTTMTVPAQDLLQIPKFNLAWQFYITQEEDVSPLLKFHEDTLQLELVL